MVWQALNLITAPLKNQSVHVVINLWLSLISSDKINMQLLLGCHQTLSEEWVHTKMLVTVCFLEKTVMTSVILLLYH